MRIEIRLLEDDGSECETYQLENASIRLTNGLREVEREILQSHKQYEPDGTVSIQIDGEWPRIKPSV